MTAAETRTLLLATLLRRLPKETPLSLAMRADVPRSGGLPAAIVPHASRREDLHAHA